MGCDSYYLSGCDNPIRFSESDDDVCCLCTFPHNDGKSLSRSRIQSLAYLGAAVVLMQRGDIANGYIPSCLPEWIRRDIDSVVFGDTITERDAGCSA